MTPGDRPAVRHFSLRYSILALTYLRMRLYARNYGYSMPHACNRLLDLALDGEGIPRDPESLLGSPGKTGD